MSLYPMLLAPALHVKVWGGRQLETVMNKSLPTPEPYGESWELHDTSTVINGEYAGQTLGQLLEQLGTDLVGTNNDPANGFPLLAKLLDAEQWLSIQVHPNDEQARELENDPRGKTEAWIILAAQPGAKLVTGVQPGTSQAAMAQAIRENKMEDILYYEEVKQGDVLYVEANTIHALGPDILLYEIQQSSDVTYRLYDWGRMGLDGKPRELHIDKGVQVSNLDTLPPITHPDTSDTVSTLVSERYFTTRLFHADGAAHQIETNGFFHALTCIEGNVEIAANDQTISLSLGQSALIPASIEQYSTAGNGKALCSSQE